MDVQNKAEGFDKIALALLWFNVFVAIASFVYFNSPGSGYGITAALALGIFPTAMHFMRQNDEIVPIINGIAQAAIIGVILAAYEGHPYQVDIHMYFFAVAAINVGWYNIKALLGFTGMVAIHHLGLNFLYPTLVFPGGTDTARVLLHAVILIVETASLVWIVSELNKRFAEGHKATENSRKIAKQAQNLSDEQQSQSERIAEQKRELDDYIAAFHGSANEALRFVRENSQNMQSNTISLTQTMEETSGQAAEAMNASNEALTNVQSAAEAAAELSASIGKIVGQVEQTTHVVSDASNSTHQTDKRVASLAQSADQIGNVVSLIKDIAEQTNLLALNASIEAARAGDAGRGFAIVASEVKGLAEQTANATEEIGGQIVGIQKETQDAVISIREIATTMSEVNGLMANISVAVEEQSSSTDMISQNVQSAAQFSSKVSENIHSVTQAVGTSAASVTSVGSEAQEISERTDDLENVVNNFLDQVAVTSK